jgi:hypothetical protein
MSRELFRLVGVWSGCWVVRDTKMPSSCVVVIIIVVVVVVVVDIHVTVNNKKPFSYFLTFC